MIPRPFTCCCAVLAIASGFFLYTKKHQTTLLDQQISKIVSDTERVRAQTAMLRTEWALENQPERLTRLAEHHLVGLHTMDPAQFVRMTDLAARLPAPTVKGPVEDPRAGMTAATLASALPAAPVAVAHPDVIAVADSKPARPALLPHRDHATDDSSAPAPHAVMTVAEDAPARPAPAIRAVVHHERASRPTADDTDDVAMRMAQLSAPVPAARPVTPRHVAPQMAEAPRSSQPVIRTPVTVASAAESSQPVHRQSAPAPTRVAAATPRPSVADSEADSQVRHPLPVTVASWHATRQHRAATPSAGYVEARATSSYSGGSLLSHGDDALPAPVPMTN
ncbi:cell division protein FtsL [Acetobacter orleanensis]|uniref:Cell division protein FtsL n=1 Tax=Acetobacter orleanensis TaxID=104099 RepID=A0A4Y3TMH3_9PROT|nr:hypothetical protein [Acetobacter orleanensis]KXV63558.1 hypothetical protein AD949_07140 [Acetobacter orleanensis]PCD79877.1 hypothetical protein CO710_03135 [Acetobacter orleanensis]GAN68174.1 hypothetical protein Abol_015_013 [Acetobacter orleanensis JCM 7639]GBR31520.1 hypothetical protein AA0473_2564 [Acetobacter orleanensis NRIC 0473]GEB82933.1 hypothetical protein AOR01nite_14100 [Acetobacter orleanensis]